MARFSFLAKFQTKLPSPGPHSGPEYTEVMLWEDSLDQRRDAERPRAPEKGAEFAHTADLSSGRENPR